MSLKFYKYPNRGKGTDFKIEHYDQTGYQRVYIQESHFFQLFAPKDKTTELKDIQVFFQIFIAMLLDQNVNSLYSFLLLILFVFRLSLCQISNKSLLLCVNYSECFCIHLILQELITLFFLII